MKREVNPQICSTEAYTLAHYEQTFREREDLIAASVRNCLSDVRHFILWFEACEANTQICKGFDTQCITTPTLTRYRTSLQANGQRSGFLEIIGKRNKYREVQLNVTARRVLEEYLPTHPPDTVLLFPSGKMNDALSERALGNIVKKFVRMGKLTDVSPHDLRHCCGYRMAASSPLHRLAQFTGHDSLSTTKLYIQGTKHDLQQAVETIAWT